MNFLRRLSLGRSKSETPAVPTGSRRRQSLPGVATNRPSASQRRRASAEFSDPFPLNKQLDIVPTGQGTGDTSESCLQSKAESPSRSKTDGQVYTEGELQALSAHDLVRDVISKVVHPSHMTRKTRHKDRFQYESNFFCTNIFTSEARFHFNFKNNCNLHEKITGRSSDAGYRIQFQCESGIF